MTLRPAFIAASLFAVLTAGAVTTVTHASTHHASKADQQLCIVLAKDSNHQHTEYYCIDVGKALH
jgi:uncharacterized membrane protein